MEENEQQTSLDDVPLEQLQATKQQFVEERTQKAAQMELPQKDSLDGLSLEDLQQAKLAHQMRNEQILAPHRQKVAGEPLPYAAGEGVGPFLARAAVAPIRGPITDLIYANAKGNLARGEHDESDLRNIALYEREKGIDQQQPEWAQWAAMPLNVGGNVAPTVLSGGANIAAQMYAGAAARQGHGALNPDAVTEAAPQFLLQMGVLKAMGPVANKLFPGAKSAIGRVGQESLTGTAGMAVADYGTYLTGLSEHGGPIKDALDGKLGEAAKATVGNLLFTGAMAVAHGAPGREQVEQFVQDVEAGRKAGLSPEAAVKKAAESQPPPEPTAPDAEPTPPVHAAEEIQGEFGDAGQAALKVKPEVAIKGPVEAPASEPIRPSPEAPEAPPAKPAEPPATAEAVAPEQVETMRAALKAIGLKSEKWAPEKVMSEARKLGIDKAAERPSAAATITESAKEPTENVADAFKGAGKAMVDNLYNGLFASLQKGSDRFAGIKDPALAKLKPFFEQGLLKTPEDVRKLVNAGYDPKAAGLESPKPAAEPAPEAPPLPVIREGGQGPPGGVERRQTGRVQIGGTEVLQRGQAMDPAEAHALEKYGEGNVVRVELHAGGKKVGHATLAEEGDSVHVAWVGAEGMKGGEGRGNHPFGPREIISLAHDLARSMPDAKWLKYTASEGRIRQGEPRLIDLDKLRQRGKDLPLPVALRNDQITEGDAQALFAKAEQMKAAAPAGEPNESPAPTKKQQDADRAAARAADRAKMAEMSAAKQAAEEKVKLTPQQKGERLNRARVEARHADVFAAADAEGIARGDVHDAAREKLKQEQKFAEEWNEVHDWLLTYKGVKEAQRNIRNETLGGKTNKKYVEELDKVKGGDEAADWLGENRPDVIKRGEQPEDAVYRIIQQGRLKASEEDAYRHALDYHLELKRAAEEESSDVRKQAQRLGRRFTEEDRRALEKELRGEEGGDEEGISGEAGDVAGDPGDFAFGANEPAEPEPAGLTDLERQILDARATGQSFRKIGKDIGLSYERVRQIEAAALQRKGQTKSFEEAVIKPRAMEAAERLREKAKLTSVGDLHAAAEEGGRKITQKLSPEQQALEDAADAFLAAAEKAGGSPDEQRAAGMKAFAKQTGVEPDVAEKLVKLGVDFLQDEGGFINPSQFYRGALKRAAQLAEGYKRAARYLGDNFGELSGEMFPRITRLGKSAGEAVARFVSAPAYARLRAPQLIDKVLGKNATDADRTLYGAVMTEEQLRYTRRAYQKKAQDESNEALRLKALGDLDGAKEHFDLADAAGKAARKVTTTIGQAWSPLKDFAHYKQLVTSQRYQEIVKAWEAHMVPEMESNYRRSQGLDPADPIDSFTQIPGRPMNLLATEEPGGTGPGGKPNFAALKMGKNPFSNVRTGAAEKYNLDLGAIVENSINRGATNAAKAEAIRTMVDEGVAEWGKPAQRIDGAKEFPFTKPPKGTQENAQQETSLYVHTDAAKEWQKAITLGDQYRIPLVTAALNSVTKAALASTAEATYHSRNLLTFLTKPGVTPQDFLKNAYGVMTKKAGIADRIVELARIGAMKEHGFESPTALAQSKLNPLNWMGKLLGVLDQTMRLTADDAFTRLQRSGRVEGSETNKRNFINQLGQYQKRAQNDLVVLLRETGLGPFATAGTNFYAQGIRALTMNPGVKATSAAHAVGLRAEMLARTVGVLSTVALANYLRWGRSDGDDKTPLGSIKVGTENGKTQYIDLTAMFSSLTRGAREVGALALAEGHRKGAKTVQTEDKALDSIFHSLMHPAAGPGVQFAYTAATGKNTMGFKVAEKPPEGVTEHWQNLVAALKNANPLIGTLTGADRPKEKATAGEKAWKTLGPFGVQSRK